MAEAAFGLPELFRADLSGRHIDRVGRLLPDVGRPGPGPFVAGRAHRRHGIIVNAASGVSGAGRAAKESLHFGTVDEDFIAYGLLTPPAHARDGADPGRPGALHAASGAHGPRHSGHLLRPAHRRTRHSHDGHGDGGPACGLRRRAVRGGDRRAALDQGHRRVELAHVTARVDERTGWVLALCALDNLVKGASGQAIQCANVALGLPETTGLPLGGMYP